MMPSQTTRKGGQRYRYYICVNAQKRGWQNCPSQSIPAAEIKQVVVEQMQRLGRDSLVLENMLTQVRQEDDARLVEWESEARRLPNASDALVDDASAKSGVDHFFADGFKGQRPEVFGKRVAVQFPQRLQGIAVIAQFVGGIAVSIQPRRST